MSVIRTPAMDDTLSPLTASDERALSRAPLFRDVCMDQIRGQLAHCTCRELQSGDLLLSPEEPNRYFYVILSGRLSVHPGGAQRPAIAVLGRGECVGEISMLDHQSPTAHVWAAQRSRVLAVPEHVLWALIEHSHALCRNLVHVLARRLRFGMASLEEGEKKANVDALTGLHNRRWLDHVFAHEIIHAGRTRTPLSLVMLDIDHFKSLNDRFGHLVGDEVLKAVGAVLRDSLRPSDMPARFGGEEFAVLLPGTPGRDAVSTADRLRRLLPQMVGAEEALNELPPVTASFGVAEMIRDDTLEDLLRAADEALYAAKGAGRDCVRCAAR